LQRVEFQKGGCGQGQNRTADTRIFSPLLYRLSYLARSLEYSLKVGASQGRERVRVTCLSSGSKSRSRILILNFLLDEVDYLAFKMNPVQRVNFLNTRRARDIDFSKIAADHVKADKV
jgi:hypothetical protein